MRFNTVKNYMKEELTWFNTRFSILWFPNKDLVMLLMFLYVFLI